VHIGVNLGFGRLHENLTDEQMFLHELELAELSERLGYDSLWAVEHHFTDYSMCPDPMTVLAYVAGRTQRIRLGTAAIILPWNQPVRVAERMVMLDIMSGGRVLLGLGRGLSRREYLPFGIPLDETRERFDEAANLVVQALETGYAEGNGRFYPVPRTPLRPEPRASFRDRLYCVAGSPDSIVSAVALGARLMSFITRPVRDLMPTFDSYRNQYQEKHGVPAPPIQLNVNMYCHEDADVAKERFSRYVNRFFMKNVEHYEMAGSHFADIKGYERYATLSQALRDAGLENAAAAYVASALGGTPSQILEQVSVVQEVMGSFDLVLVPSFGGMPYEEAQHSLELFAAEVMPAVRKMAEPAPAAI